MNRIHDASGTLRVPLSAMECTALIHLIEPALSGDRGTTEYFVPASPENRRILEAVVDHDNAGQPEAERISHDEGMESYGDEFITRDRMLMSYFIERIGQVRASLHAGAGQSVSLSEPEYALLAQLLRLLSADHWGVYHREGADAYFALDESDEARALVSAAIRNGGKADQEARLRAVAEAAHWVPVDPCELLSWLARRCARGSPA